MTGLAAGSLDRRVRIERAGMADDGYNTVPSWTALAIRWAQYIPARGREAREALGQEATLPATFRLRWERGLADLSPADRLVFLDGATERVFDVKSVIEIGRREGIEIVGMAKTDG